MVKPCSNRAVRVKSTIVGLVVLCVTTSSAWAVSFSNIVVFGDSLSDTGNLFALTGDTVPQAAGGAYFDGRFSNGPVWVEQLAQRLGLPAPTPSFLDGTNYAWGGADSSLVSSNGLSIRGTPNIGEQIQKTNLDTTIFPPTGVGYLDSNTPSSTDLFVVWGGANDFLNAVDINLVDPAVPVADISTHIGTLAAAGAEHFLVPNLPSLGQTPRHFGEPTQAIFDTLTIEFNQLLKAELDQLRDGLGVNIVMVDMFKVFRDLEDNPAAFGLTNLTGKALMDGFVAGINPVNIVPNPDEYRFWDEVHPTRVTHRVMGDRAFSALIPEPNTIALSFIGVGGLGLLTRRRMTTADRPIS